MNNDIDRRSLSSSEAQVWGPHLLPLQDEELKEPVMEAGNSKTPVPACSCIPTSEPGLGGRGAGQSRGAELGQLGKG